MKKKMSAKDMCKIAFTVFFFCFILIFQGNNNWAWNTGANETPAYEWVEIDGKKAYQTINYFSKMEHTSGNNYHNAGHIYIIQRAIDILRKDNYNNWADLALYNILHLASGSRHADAYKGRIVIRLSLDLFWGLVELDSWEFDLTCVGGCEHYHNQKTDNGLNLLGWTILAQNADFLITIVQTLSPANFTFGILDLNVDVIPDIRAQYQSGLKLCRQHYLNALKAWDGKFLYPSRSFLGSAMYELGWACHLMADLAVAQHLHNEFIGGHSDYEDAADGKGDTSPFHAFSAKDVYQLSSGSGQGDKSQPIAQLAYQLVNKLYPDSTHHYQAEKGDDSARKTALKKAIPLAEKYTAAVLARFFKDIGIPGNIPPLEGYVRLFGGYTVPYAYVFYAPVGSTIQIEQNIPPDKLDPKKNWRGWDYVRADKNGYFTIPIKKFTKYWLRPAMPGYSFKGKTSWNLEFGKNTIPVTYIPPTIAYSKDRVDVYMDKLPLQAKLALPGKIDKVAAGIDKTVLSKLSLSAPQRAGLIPGSLKLIQSGTLLSTTLADKIYQGVLKAQCRDKIMGVSGGNNNRPTETVVTFQVSNLIAIPQAKLVTSIKEIGQTVDMTRVSRKQFAAQIQKDTGLVKIQPEAGNLQFIDKNKFLAVKAMLPSQSIMNNQGQTIKVISPVDLYQGNEDGLMLLENGLLLTPAQGGVEIEVKAESGTGLLDTNVSSLKLVTDSSGMACLRVKCGSHAGKIRLSFKVTKNPKAMDIKPEGVVEILVEPAIDIADPTPQVPVKIESCPQLEIVKAVGFKVIGQQIADVYRAVVQLGPEGIREKIQQAIPAEEAERMREQEHREREAAERHPLERERMERAAEEHARERERMEREEVERMREQERREREEVERMREQERREREAAEQEPLERERMEREAEDRTREREPVFNMVDISGEWQSNIGRIYIIRQEGNSFSWQVRGKEEEGHGQIFGRNIKAWWRGELGEGNSEGEIKEITPEGRALLIHWKNGVIFNR